jgi:hypothetical protein
MTINQHNTTKLRLNGGSITVQPSPFPHETGRMFEEVRFSDTTSIVDVSRVVPSFGDKVKPRRF